MYWFFLDPAAEERKNRILRLRDSAQLLTSRIQETSSAIVQHSGSSVPEMPPPTVPPEAWGLQKPSPAEEIFVSKYDKMTGAHQDYSVFNKDLPGTPTVH